MKTVKLYLAFLFVGLPGLIQAQQQWSNPQPTGYANSSLQFRNESTGFFLNSNGDLVQTQDTGRTWTRLKNYVKGNSFSLKFGTGIITGFDSSIYISKDNGDLFVKQKLFPGSLNSWSDIVSRDTIFVLKALPIFGGNALYKSVDRGASWQEINPLLDQFNIGNLDFINSNLGLVSRADGIYRTTNGGVSWSQVYNVSTSNTIVSLKFFNTQLALAFQQGVGVLRSVNGGQNWQVVPNTSAYDFGTYFFLDATTVFTIGFHTIYRSLDGGSTWTNIGPGGIGNLFYSLYFFNQNSGIVVGEKGEITRTTDGGLIWKPYSPFWRDVNESDFADVSTGYAVTRDAVYKTINNGQLWTRLTVPAPPLPNGYFDHCHFFTRDSGFITTADPVRFYKTTDGGLNWQVINPVPPGNHVKITGYSFIDKDTGYIVTNTGVDKGLFKTYNGGLSWQEIGTRQDFTLIQFLNDQMGFATKYDKVYWTANGGASWVERPTLDYVELTSIYFLNPVKGFVTANQGNLKMTLDSGRTWTRITVDPASLPNLVKIKFYRDNLGYLTETGGRYFKSLDGGLTWRSTGRTAFSVINSIDFKEDSSAVLSGLYGTIVLNAMRECKMEGIDVGNSNCGNMFKGTLIVFDATADSVYFEYGKNSYTDRILANPSPVTNNTVNFSIPVSLEADSVYKMRMRVNYAGGYRYSDEIYFVARFPVPVPTITANGNMLSSSAASGNQWYLNGVIIPGATTQQYTATASGVYTVVVTQNGCTSQASAGVTITITAIPDINPLSKEVFVYPNPVVDDLLTVNIGQNRNMEMSLFNAQGILYKKASLNPGINYFHLTGMSSGIYLVKVRDTRKNLEIGFRVIILNH